jgi:uncharacterized membrane protein SpoIIM required for sporulation/uncharacterized RDD family membrane protein YckC
MTPPAAQNSKNNSGLDDIVAIETPEMVLVSYTIAGVGSRVAAALIDLTFCIVTLLALGMVLAVISGEVPAATSPETSSAWAFAIVFLVQFAFLWGYYVLYEGLNDGQTLGKQLMRLRVVMDAGYSVTFSASAIRNIVRLIDMQPAILGAVGIVSIGASRSGKRIGDMIAGTMVVKEQPVAVPHARAAGAERREESNGARTVASNILSDAEFEVLTRYVNRRNALEAADRGRLAGQLAARFRSRMPDSGGTDAAFLLRLHESETVGRGQGSASRGASGAARERHAILLEGKERWAAFAKDLELAQKRALKNLPEEQVSRFVAQYRELSNDLARLRTATRGADPTSVFALSRLVAAAHNLIYKGRGIPAARILQFLASDVPREVRKSAGPILLAASLFFGPMAIAYRATTSRPALASEILPAGMLERAEEGIQRAKTRRGYIEDPKSARPIMGSMIIANNIQVAFMVFAFGITVIGTTFALVANGVMIGGILGLYQSKGIIKLLLAFVAPHSVLELSAITIAGGAGLLIASAILLPGFRTRREALVENGKRAMRLLTCAVLFLLVAGSLEGLVSPIPNWPLSWKVAVAGATLVLMLGYLSLGARRTATSLPGI